MQRASKARSYSSYTAPDLEMVKILQPTIFSKRFSDASHTNIAEALNELSETVLGISTHMSRDINSNSAIWGAQTKHCLLSDHLSNTQERAADEIVMETYFESQFQKSILRSFESEVINLAIAIRWKTSTSPSTKIPKHLPATVMKMEDTVFHLDQIVRSTLEAVQSPQWHEAILWRCFSAIWGMQPWVDENSIWVFARCTNEYLAKTANSNLLMLFQPWFVLSTRFDVFTDLERFQTKFSNWQRKGAR